MGRSINQFELKEADVVLRPLLTGLSAPTSRCASGSSRAGRDAATRLLPTLQARIAALTR